MLRTRDVQPSLWESVLPEVCLRLPVELERVDELLDDERFFAPFRVHFDARRLSGPVLAIANGLDAIWASLSTATVGTHPVSGDGLDLGGSPAADAEARRDGWPKVLAFLGALSGPNAPTQPD